MQTHGHLQLEIKQLVKSGQTPDLTRNGVARGYVVVPEFPSGAALLLIASVFMAVLVVQRKFWRINGNTYVC